MPYRIELTDRAERDVRRLFEALDAQNSAHARTWLAGLERLILSLDERPGRGAAVREDPSLKQVLHGRGRNVYRIIYAINEPDRIVSVLHIRHGALEGFDPSIGD